jgi:hypothetical protein
MRLRHGGILEEWEPRSTGRKRRLAAVFAVLIALAAGFVLGHWSSDRLSQQLADEAAAQARHSLAAAVCAEAFMRQPAARERLAERAQAGWEERGEKVAQGGWATMPDEAEPQEGAAARCALRLGEAYTSMQKTTPVSARE